jgi:hypothetical protein
VSQLQVTDITVPVLLKKLRTREWLVPQFQRDFVWSNAAVISLVNSIIDSRPVGMVTLWEQQENTSLQLEPVSVPDWITEQNAPGRREYVQSDSRPGRYYAVLDGRQRSTALALAFGGLRALSGIYRNAGAYYLDVTARDDGERVKYFSQKDIERRGINTLPGAIGKGLFPLAVADPDKLMGQWMEYLQLIYNQSYYENGSYPDSDELKRRNEVLSKAFSGVFNTKLAVYIVPSDYTLGEICEIFSTLNTTGAKVSTVDLIHSNLFNDTVNNAGGPLLLRDRIDALGQLDGAVGWASSRDRPELVAQLVAAAYVAADTKPSPRPSGPRETKISSVKSADLLALPASFWRRIFENNAKFANFLGGFQRAVAGGSFTMAQCPYPASAAIYVGLRWFLEFDGSPYHWNVERLDNLFRAFFWRNALASRYDQGFLTQIGTDILDMKAFLNATTADTDEEYWRTQANGWLDKTVGPRPSRDDICALVSSGDERGAARRSALLLLYARARQDVVTPELNISAESGTMELHHIYPKDWCKKNAAALLDQSEQIGSELKWVNSAANLMPMHRITNNEWKDSSPATFLLDKSIDYDGRQDNWNWYFIDRDSFKYLLANDASAVDFWARRAEAITTEIFDKTAV